MGEEAMTRGASGRVVIEIDPLLKAELYEALNEEGLNLKQWFLSNIDQYLAGRIQPALPIFRKDAEKVAD